MKRHCVWGVGLGICLFAPMALAQPTTNTAAQQHTGATESSASAVTATPHARPGGPAVTTVENRPQRFGRSREHSLGLRAWLWNTPAWMTGLFAHVEGDWSGPLTVTPALEYVFRNGMLDIVVGLQYMNLSTGPGYIRGKSESDLALERVESQLWTLGVNALFLYTSRINDWFEIQYGGGVGVSYVGGDLYRNQVERNPSGSGYIDCRVRPPPGGTPTSITGGGYCDQSNNHYVYSNGTRYSEPRSTSGGSLPPAIPFVALPHVALHFRPHRNVDIRVDGGFGIIGFYGGLATHFVF